MTKQNDAARDLWAQIFERAAADINATMHEPDEDGDAQQQETLIRAMKEAGWSEAEIEWRQKTDRNSWGMETVNSPGVGPGLEFKLKHLADHIKKAIPDSGINSLEKVEIAIEPKAGVSASLIHVTMTDQGILAVSSFFFRWCGLIARAYIRTLNSDVRHWASNNTDTDIDRERLLKHPNLMLYWFRIFFILLNDRHTRTCTIPSVVTLRVSRV